MTEKEIMALLKMVPSEEKPVCNCHKWETAKNIPFYHACPVHESEKFAQEQELMKKDHEKILAVESSPKSMMQTSFEQAVEPLIKWLAENMHPHATVIVTSNRAELVEGTICYQTDKFITN